MTRPTSLVLCVAEATGSWSKPLSRMVSMASSHGEDAEIVVTGLRRREAIVAPAKGSLARSVGDKGAIGSGGVTGGVGGRRSLAASQSSSANYSRCQCAHIWVNRGRILPCSSSFECCLGEPQPRHLPFSSSNLSQL